MKGLISFFVIYIMGHPINGQWLNCDVLRYAVLTNSYNFKSEKNHAV